LVADGQALGLSQDTVCCNGHAIEVRINAEAWRNDFRPSPGRVTRARWPAGAGIRVDTHIGSGGVVPPFYDSLLGKLIVVGANRDVAVARLSAALAVLDLQGVETTVDLHRRIVGDPRFVRGAVDTRFFEEMAHG
jgi:acetyl-CoA carboxylase biotin carboxylase subunit